MINGFVEISRSKFLTETWPKIVRSVEAGRSNWKTPQDECFPPLIIIHWVTRDPGSLEKTPLAVCSSDGEGPDRYWVAPDLL